MRITRFKIKDGRLPFVIQIDDKLLELNLTPKNARKLRKALGRSLEEIDN